MTTSGKTNREFFQLTYYRSVHNRVNKKYSSLYKIIQLNFHDILMYHCETLEHFSESWSSMSIVFSKRTRFMYPRNSIFLKFYNRSIYFEIVCISRLKYFWIRDSKNFVIGLWFIASLACQNSWEHANSYSIKEIRISRSLWSVRNWSTMPKQFSYEEIRMIYVTILLYLNKIVKSKYSNT